MGEEGQHRAPLGSGERGAVDVVLARSLLLWKEELGGRIVKAEGCL